MKVYCIIRTAVLLVCCMALPVIAAIKGSPHDLSAMSSGDACSFCHTPHSAVVKRPMWSHKLSDAVYKIYQSSSLDAKVGQPTGNSKFCLSCHDGTVALAHTGKRGGGGAFITPGASNLGTDLSDDHPISFVYSDALSGKDPQIRPGSMLPEELKLDRGSELQCTTCHDVHDNKHGNFLAKSNHRSAMCITCHDLRGWANSSHESSNASVGSAQDAYLRASEYGTVADNGCLSCHRPHSAGGRERLLHFEKMEDNCLNCHNGSVAGTNLRHTLLKKSGHNVTRYFGVHDLKESPSASERHVECVDCHNPHSTREGATQAPVVHSAMQQVSGVTISGSVTEQAQHEYEVCLKCHGDNPNRVESTITRQITQTNTRLEFEGSNPSFHPVVSQGINSDVPSLIPPMSVTTIIYCSDCHSSDETSDAKGPHSSNYAPLLMENYETSDLTQESDLSYALCYKCHSRNSILNNESFTKHSTHLEDDIPCSACHDAHGISSSQGTSTENSHLINFDITIVDSDSVTGRLAFEDGMEAFTGTCWVNCHNRNHSGVSY